MSAKQELLALLNSANGRSYTEAQVSFGVPSVVGAPVNGKNTAITVSGVAGAGYTGSKDLTFARLDLTTCFTGHPLVSAGPAEAGTLQEVLDDIFAQTGVRIEPEDLSNAADVDFSQAEVVLTAKAESLKWIGTVTVSTSVDLRDIGTEINTTELPGFEYPTIA